ncbi:glycosyltransferase family 1 protein, partial [Pseudomonas sp. 5S1]|nr:glycosyltransferase family 1 protein [Pseudomonas sp. 5S1]
VSRSLGLNADALIAVPPSAEELAGVAAELEALKPPPLTLNRRFVISRHYLHMWGLDKGKSLADPVLRTHFLSQWYW